MEKEREMGGGEVGREEESKRGFQSWGDGRRERDGRFLKVGGTSSGSVDPHCSRAPPLDRRDSLFIIEKLIFRKVGVATYFILFFLKRK